MTTRNHSRRRILLFLFIAIPGLFFAVIYLTTGTAEVPFVLASVSDNTVVLVSERLESMMFMAVATVGFLVSFLSLTLIQKDSEIHRRLVLCGYRPAELIIANLLFLCIVLAVVSVYVTLLLSIFFRPEHVLLLMAGFALAGYVYGIYGLMIGSIVKGELEGILCIVLLANIDAGWLQNPVFYVEAQHEKIIHYLPAYYPSQACFISGFSDYDVTQAFIGSALYGACFLVVALVVYTYRMKTH